jgi:hypothetical protein
VSLDLSCAAGDICADPNAACILGTCRCRDGYSSDSGKCTSAGKLNSPCLSGGTCLESNLICTSGTCRCRQNFFPKNGKCGKLNIPIISLNSDYIIYHSFINNCHVFVSESTIALGLSCDVGDVCRNTNSQCRNGICQCWEMYYENNGQCGRELA